MSSEFTYYIISLNEKFAKKHGYENRLYAYTENKLLKKRFEKTRDMDLFHIDKMKLTKSQVNYLAKEYRESYLVYYDFIIEEDKVSVPVTMSERMTIDGISAKILFVDIYATSRIINPIIFSEYYRDILKSIGYIECYMLYNMGIQPSDKIKANTFRIFIESFGKLINIGGLFE